MHGATHNVSLQIRGPHRQTPPQIIKSSADKPPHDHNVDISLLFFFSWVISSLVPTVEINAITVAWTQIALTFSANSADVEQDEGMYGRNQSIQWVRTSRGRPSCHCADWVHKAGMLIGGCSGPRASIIQQTGLFSIQLVLLLVVMAAVVMVVVGERED